MSNLLKTRVEAAKALVSASQAEYFKKAQESISQVAYDAVIDGKTSFVFRLSQKTTGLNAEYANKLWEWVEANGFKVDFNVEDMELWITL